MTHFLIFIGMEELHRWLHNTRLYLASASPWGLHLARMRCHIELYRARTRHCILRRGITGRRDAIRRTESLVSTRVVSVGVSYLSGSKRRSSFRGLETDWGRFWLEAHESSWWSSGFGTTSWVMGSARESASILSVQKEGKQFPFLAALGCFMEFKWTSVALSSFCCVCNICTKKKKFRYR